MVRSHYETLGVSETASLKEIKKAFRKLSMETHPDVSPSSGERFKQVSQAYNVLSNEKERRLYDIEWKEAQRFGGFDNMRRAHEDRFRKKAAKAHMQSQVLETIYRPRSIILGLIGISVLSAVYSWNKKEDEELANIRKYGGKAPKVEAWKNPKTNQWEIPAPWDPYYQKLRPELHFVPRDQVQDPKR